MTMTQIIPIQQNDAANITKHLFFRTTEFLFVFSDAVGAATVTAIDSVCANDGLVCMCGGLGRAVSGVLDPVYRDNLVKPKGDALAGGLAIAQSILNQSQPIQNMDSKQRPLEN